MIIERYTKHLVDVFKRAPSKHEANVRAKPIIGDAIGDRGFLTEVLRNYLAKPENLNRLNYPVVALDGPLNEYFGLVVNCWIPLPDKRADISSKAIHHHGDMLLTTGTILGPGYMHWLFSKPRVLDSEREIFEIQVTEKEQHPAGHIAFVDHHIPHLPWYPTDLSITLCLWSNHHPTTWRDRVKRIPILKKNEQTLRKIVNMVGLNKVAARALDIKLIEYYDYYPTETGMKGMRERDEYKRGPNADHLHSLFHVIQRTGHESLGPLIRTHVNSGHIQDRVTVEKLLGDLESGRPIEGRLSDCHMDLPHTTFTPDDVAGAVGARIQVA
jgi:hypothetical protein